MKFILTELGEQVAGEFLLSNLTTHLVERSKAPERFFEYLSYAKVGDDAIPSFFELQISGEYSRTGAVTSIRFDKDIHWVARPRYALPRGFRLVLGPPVESNQ